MGSTRLPGKVLADLGGRPLLVFMLERLEPLDLEVVVATTDHRRDDPVAEVAAKTGALVVRGPEHDVLARFALALDRFPADLVVRLTADCPLVDPALVEHAVSLLRVTGADYVSNTLVRTFPDGLDVEVVSAGALRAAAAEAIDPAEREHVTPFIYRRTPRFTLRSLRTDELLGDERWTVDTEHDLAFVRSAVERLGGDAVTAGWRTVLDAIGRRVEPPARGELRLRPAVEPDRDLLLAWRNDPAAVRFSRGHRAVLPQEHRAWFSARLIDPSTRIWIGEVDGVAVGQVRVDVDAGTGLVSLVVAPEARGRGLAVPLLWGLEIALRGDLQVGDLVAEVHVENEASIRTFERAGYRRRSGKDDFDVYDRPLGNG